MRSKLSKTFNSQSQPSNSESDPGIGGSPPCLQETSITSDAVERYSVTARQYSLAPDGAPIGVSTALQQTLYNLVIANEVSSNQAIADTIGQPGLHQGGNGAPNWTFGWIQDDFTTSNGRANGDALLRVRLIIIFSNLFKLLRYLGSYGG
jgi:hypothetical protein